MADADDRFAELAGAVADGATLDWTNAARTASDPAERAAIEALRELALLGDAFASANGPADRRSSARPRLESGASWGHLRIVEHVGRGRFGEVYRAWDAALQRNVALKLITEPDAGQPAVLDDRVVEEGRLMARVRHPNVVAIYGAQRIDGVTGLWMEFVEGRTLEAELAEHGPFDRSALTAVGRQLCEALAAVHDAGLVHRDVKASNVLRDQSGRVVLGDFGTGREFDDADEMRSGLAGTPAYLAPEIFAHQPATPQSDLYSLGVLLFRLATGAYPVRGRSLRELKEAHAAGPASSATTRPDLPAPLATVIDRLLLPDPSKRFESARAVERALQPTPRRVSIVIVAGAAAIAVAVAAGEILRRSGPPIAPPSTALEVSSASTTSSTPPPSPIADPPPAPPARSSTPQSNTTKIAPVPGVLAGLQMTQLSLSLQPKHSLRGPSPDGISIACHGHPQNVAVCNLQTGQILELRAATETEHASAGRSMMMSPDGKRVAYKWLTAKPQPSDQIRVIDADGKNDRLLHDGSATIVRWTRDSSGVVLQTGSRPMRRDVVVAAIDGGVPRQLWTLADHDDIGDTSPDGSAIVVERSRARSNRDLVVINLMTSLETPLTSGPADDFSPQWTVDGKGIAFLSDRVGGHSLMLTRIPPASAPSEPTMLKHFGRDRVRLIGFGVDGALYAMFTQPWRTAFTAPVDVGRRTAGDARLIDRFSLEDTLGPDWSPDGKRVAYLRGHPADVSRSGTVVIQEGSGARIAEVPLPYWITSSGQVRWSPDGTSLAVAFGADATTPNVATIGIVSPESRRLENIITGVDAASPRWDPSGNALLYRLGPTIRRYDLVSRETTSVHDDRRHPVGGAGFDVGPDAVIATAIIRDRRCMLAYLDRGALVDRHHFATACSAIRWIQGGRKVLVSTVDATGQGSVYVLDRVAGAPARLRLNAPMFHSLSLREDGMLAYASGNFPFYLWRITGVR